MSFVQPTYYAAHPPTVCRASVFSPPEDYSYLEPWLPLPFNSPFPHGMTQATRSLSFGAYTNMSDPSAVPGSPYLVPPRVSQQNNMGNATICEPSAKQLPVNNPSPMFCSSQYVPFGTPQPTDMAPTMTAPPVTCHQRSSSFARKLVQHASMGLQASAPEFTSPMPMSSTPYLTPPSSSHSRVSSLQTVRSSPRSPTPLPRDITPFNTSTNANSEPLYNSMLHNSSSGSQKDGSVSSQGPSACSVSKLPPDREWPSSLPAQKLLNQSAHLDWALQELELQLEIISDLYEVTYEKFELMIRKQVDAVARRIWIADHWVGILGLCRGNRKRVDDLKKINSRPNMRNLIKVQLQCHRERIMKDDASFRTLPKSAVQQRNMLLTDQVCREHIAWFMKWTDRLKKQLPEARATKTKASQTKASQMNASQMNVTQTKAPHVDSVQTAASQGDAVQVAASQMGAIHSETSQVNTLQTDAPKRIATQAEVPQVRTVQLDDTISEAPQTQAQLIDMKTIQAENSHTDAMELDATDAETANEDSNNTETPNSEASNTEATDTGAIQTEAIQPEAANAKLNNSYASQAAKQFIYSLPDIYAIDQPMPALPPAQDVVGDTVGYFNEAIFWNDFKGQDRLIEGLG